MVDFPVRYVKLPEGKVSYNGDTKKWIVYIMENHPYTYSLEKK